MGRARGNIQQATAGSVIELGSRRRHDDSARLDSNHDALWFSKGQALTEATRLLRRIDHLTDREADKLHRLMARIGAAVGLEGPWRLIERADGQLRLGHCSWLNREHPDAPEHSRWQWLDDRFTGGTIDRLPEQRYLGRRVQELAQMVAMLPEPQVVASVA